MEYLKVPLLRLTTLVSQQVNYHYKGYFLESRMTRKCPVRFGVGGVPNSHVYLPQFVLAPPRSFLSILRKVHVPQ